MAVRTRPDWPKGEIVCFKHQSKVLRDNIWSDPAERDFHVYLPHGYSESGEALVALWDFAAFTNAGPGHLNWKNQGENLPQRLDRLIGSGEMPPVVVPMPDCYSSLGGNQYINSSAIDITTTITIIVDEIISCRLDQLTFFISPSAAIIKSAILCLLTTQKINRLNTIQTPAGTSVSTHGFDTHA